MDDSNEYKQAVFPLSHYKLLFDELLKGNYKKIKSNDLELNYAEEQLRLVSKHRRYKSNSSEKVNPDNNKAPGCLSHTWSRIRYHCMLPGSNGVRLYDQSVLMVLAFVIVGSLLIYFISKIPAGPLYSLDSSEPYSAEYKLPMMTKEYGIEFYVKSIHGFNKKYRLGTPARANIENEIMLCYVQMVQIYRYHELKWHVLRPDFPTPICNELQTLRMHT